MELSRYVAELRESLASAAALGDEHTQRSVSGLAAALEPAARLALLHALSDMAAEVTHQLASTNPIDADTITVDVQLEGRDVRIATHRSWSSSGETGGPPSAPTAGPSARPSAGSAADEPPADPDATPGENPRSFAEASGDFTRTTVRMFNELKGQAEKAAAEQGVSLNAFISRAVSESIRGEKGRRGQRGWDRPQDGRGRRQSGTTISGYVQG